MDRTLRLLLVEDNEDDALLLMHRLEKEGYRIEADRVENGHDMTRLLNEKTYDLIVCDYSLPKFSGEHALDIFHQSGLDIPFILVSGTIGEDVAVGMMKLGAHDYIMKDNIRRIGPAVTRELAEAEIRRQRKQALEDLRLAKEKAEQSDRLKSTLLSNMSHEFRTPLTGILGFAQVIKELTSDPELQNCAQRIHKSGMRLMKTLDSIVWLSQLESGLLPSLKEFDLAAMMRSVFNLHTEFIQYKKLRADFDPGEGVIAGSDEELLARAFSSILDNAIKYTREGGITISSGPHGESSGGMHFISVADTGIGIPESQTSNIFEAFKQVSEGFSRQFEGIGLGLTIARKVMHLLNGSILVESTPGRGSIFTLVFPLRDPSLHRSVSRPQREAAPTPTPEPPVLSKPSILVVEDNDTNAELVSMYLQSTYNVFIASNGPDALKTCRARRYDLILLDINLGPDMNGIDVVHELKKLPDYVHTPMIAMTGLTQYGDRSRLLQEGFTHYIGKPFTKKGLNELLQRIFLPGSSSGEEDQ